MATRKSQSLSMATAAALVFSSASLAAASPGFLSLPIERSKVSRDSGLSKRALYDFDMANEAFQYTTNVSLGNPPQTVKVQVDTGSSDLVIFAPNSCDPSYPDCIPQSYDPTKSKTSTLLAQGLFKTRYGDGSGATGDYYSDTVKINSLTVDNQTFGLATQTSGLQIGLIGLGYDTDEAIYSSGLDGPYTSFLDSLVNQSIISTKSFSMWLDAVEAPTGQMLLGGYDTSRWTGNLIVVNTQASPDTGKVHEYFAPWTGLGIYNGKQYLSLTGSDFAVPALMDSGTSGILLPDEIYSAMLELFGLPTPSSGRAPVGDCSAEAPSSAILTFSFGGAKGGFIEVPAQEMLQPLLNNDGSIGRSSSGKPQCEFPIFPSGGDSVIFGDAFLRSAYVVFDLDNNLLGLASTNFGAKVDDISNAKPVPSGGIASIPNAIVATEVTIVPTAAAAVNLATSVAPLPSGFQTNIPSLPAPLAAASKAAAPGPVAAPMGLVGLCAMAAAAGLAGLSGASLLFL